MRRIPLVNSLACAVCGILFLGSPNAMGQDALGGGNALDSNTQVGSGGRNTGRPANPYAGRNSVITGEVIGGREFRGRVGYTAPGDFRGSLGSNDLYRFRASSAWSSPESFRLFGSTYEQLRFGQGLGVLELSRSGAGATPDLVQQSPGPTSFSGLVESRLRYDNAMLSASTNSRVNAAVQPMTLGIGMTADGREVAITASSVRGLTLDPFNRQWENLGLTTYDQIRIREELNESPAVPAAPQLEPGAVPPGAEQTPPQSAALPAQRVGQTFETRFENLRTSDVSESARVDTSSTDYNRILQNIADRYARDGDREVRVDPAILKRLSDDYARVREHLAGQSVSDAAPRLSQDPGAGSVLPTQPPSEQAPSASPNPGRTDQQPRDEPRRDPRATGTEPDDETTPSRDLTQMGPVLRHGQKLENLTSEQQGRFNELMLAAEQQLRNGDFMLAEQRFQRALRFAPGHPMAMAGAANAQLGAGLYLPAGFTIKSLFTQNPEMIDVTYGRDLLPDDERLASVVEGLNARLELGKDRAYLALALAYIGRQTENRALMEQGIDIMLQEQADDPLALLLRNVWLEGEQAPETSGENAPPAGDPQK